MDPASPAVVVTGISGNLGLRLLEQLTGFQVIGVDLVPPETSQPIRFIAMDIGQEESCRELYLLFKQYRPVAVIHLAFVIDPIRSGVTDLDQMWQVNVAGTARVMEAIAETNREEAIIEKFIYPSSVAVYGPNLSAPATEDATLAAHTLPYAIHKMECDNVVQQRAPGLRGCSLYMLRAHILSGAGVRNYMMDAFRGTPTGKSKRAARMRSAGKRLPYLLPYGKQYPEHLLQFLHVDDMARLIVHIMRKTDPEAQRLTILNVAGRGESLRLSQCIEIARTKLVKVPGHWGMRMVLGLFSKLGLSTAPAEAEPYMSGQYTMDTTRLRDYLGKDHETVIQHSNADAYSESFSS
jgi:nucleoside-diphosphate-sugar epimerase